MSSSSMDIRSVDHSHSMMSSQTAPEASVFTTVSSHTRPTRESVLQRLSEALLRRSLIKIDLSQRGLWPADARLVKMALLQNAHVSVLKLGYNNLGDDGTAILSSGISQHPALESLDLGFNNIGDEGCQALATAIPPNVHTLYLAGNLIGEDGAFSIADLIRRNSSLHKLYMTGNRLGAEGVQAIINAILECENASAEEEKSERRACMQELFLGGTDMGVGGCQAIASLLGRSTTLRVLSLPNCDFNDDSLAMLAANMKVNRQSLPLESLQLSFNRISSLEHLANALWGSRTIKTLKLDNNKIGDIGAHHIAGVLSTLSNLETLDIGFNCIKTRGMMSLMKAAADSPSIKHLSVAGNVVDANGAKAITYALAYSQSLKSISVVKCNIDPDCQRQIVAGVVSNRRTALRAISGFSVGPVVVTLGFPPPLEHWNNEQVFNFVQLMWSKSRNERVALEAEEEKNTDPLSFLGGPANQRPAPLEAAVVVELAKKTFASLVEEGVDVFSRLPGHSYDTASPIAGDTIVQEESPSSTRHPYPSPSGSTASLASQKNSRSFVVPPEQTKSTTPDPAHKKRIVEWLCTNIQHLHKIAQQPFSSSELGRLHQHYFTPVVNESGGNPVGDLPLPSAELSSLIVPAVSLTSSEMPTENPIDSVGDSLLSCGRDSSVKSQPNGIASLPMLKRKVSYRFLGDASLASAPRLEATRRNSQPPSVTMLIEGGPVGHSLPRKSKRARRNRSRISFLPRVKAKLDSYLDVCHEKALTTMRQLYYVERAILAGQVNPIDPTKTARTHLCGDFATDAETIIVDMI